MVSITAAEEVLLTLHSSTICFPCSPRLRKAWVFSHACSVEGIRLTLRALQSVSATYRLGADEADISAIVLLDRLLLDLLRHVSSLIHLPKCTCRVPPLSPRLSMPPLCALLLLLASRDRLNGPHSQLPVPSTEHTCSFPCRRGYPRACAWAWKRTPHCHHRCRRLRTRACEHSQESVQRRRSPV